MYRIFAHFHLALTQVLHRPRSVHPSLAQERGESSSSFRRTTGLSDLSDRHHFRSGGRNVDDIAMLHVCDGLRHAAMQFTGRCDMPRMLDRFPRAWRSQHGVECSTEAALPPHDEIRVLPDICIGPYLRLSYYTSTASRCRPFSRSLGPPYKSAPSEYAVIAPLPRALGNSHSVRGFFAGLVRTHVRCYAETPQQANARCRPQSKRITLWTADRLAYTFTNTSLPILLYKLDIFSLV